MVKVLTTDAKLKVRTERFCAFHVNQAVTTGKLRLGLADETAALEFVKVSVIIRDIELVSEMRRLEALQKDVWGYDDRDVVPLTMFAATKEVGAILVGAYDGSSLVGFVYGFLGCEEGRIVHHSHMLAVRPSYRNFNLGYKLKLAQRERVLADWNP